MAKVRKQGPQDIPEPPRVPRGYQARWIPGHYRMIKLGKSRRNSKKEEKKEVSSSGMGYLMEALATARRPGATAVEKRVATRMLNNEVRRRSVDGKDPRYVRLAILSWVNRKSAPV